jgi:ankyrin repeat protein
MAKKAKRTNKTRNKRQKQKHDQNDPKERKEHGEQSAMSTAAERGARSPEQKKEAKKRQGTLNAELFAAIEKKNLERLDRALEAGANPMAKSADRRRESALAAAIRQRFRGGIDRLLPLSDWSACNAMGSSALCGAMAVGDVKTAKILLEHAASDATTKLGRNFLMSAVEGGKRETIELAIEAAVACGRVDERNHVGFNALMIAANRGDLESLRALLPWSEPGARSMHGRNALMIAAEAHLSTCADCVAELLRRDRALAMDVDERGHDALMRAAARGHAKSVALLLPWSDPARKAPGGESAFTLAKEKASPSENGPYWAILDMLAPFAPATTARRAHREGGDAWMPRWAALQEAASIRQEIGANATARQEAKARAEADQKTALDEAGDAQTAGVARPASAPAPAPRRRSRSL